MTETPWFHDRHVDEPEQDETGKRFYQFRVGALLAILIVILAGCATARDAEVCYVKPMGNTEEGLIVVLQQCLTPEAFAESQK